eukprot:PITA_01047
MAFKLSASASITGAACILLASVLLQASLCFSASNNPIDNCWNNGNWQQNRKKLADCAIGFGSAAQGGKAGEIYTVTTPEDNAADPQPGSLRYGVTRKNPLWIVFAKDMIIKLQMPLIVTSQKTIDARGAKVQIGNGPCLRIDNVKNVIIHGLQISNCVPNARGNVRVAEGNGGVQLMDARDGDAISVTGSTDIWIDHNTLSKCEDGLLDVTLGSTATMLLGHDDTYDGDKNMKVTVAYNHFGPGLTQRMPRFGYVHVVNNNYEPWGSYAIGGSMHPTIRSEGNRFVAPSSTNLKEVTWRENCGGGDPTCPNGWLWVSAGDQFLNGAYFNASGKGTAVPPYSAAQQFAVGRGSSVQAMTTQAGALN